MRTFHLLGMQEVLCARKMTHSQSGDVQESEVAEDSLRRLLDRIPTEAKKGYPRPEELGIDLTQA